MRVLARLLQLIYFLYAAIIFLALMIPVFLFAITASTLGVIRGGNLIFKACRVWGDVWFPMIGIIHRNIYEQRPEGGKVYIYISNHISWLDAALIPKVLRYSLSPLGKIETTEVPIFGFIYKKAIVSVDRSSQEKRYRSVQRLKSVLRKGISILVFPEGTFNETHKPPYLSLTVHSG